MKKLIIVAIAIVGFSAASFATTIPTATKSNVSTATAGTVKKIGIFGKHHHKKHHRKAAKAAL